MMSHLTHPRGTAAERHLEMSYDDITIVEQGDLTGVNDLYPDKSMDDLVDECLIHLDLRREAKEYLVGNERDVLSYLQAHDANSQLIEILYMPSEHRAGIAYGGPAEWTDADSIEDALDRYFGVDGKEIVP